MFVGDNKNRQRSGSSVGGNWQYQNRQAAAGQHTTAEGVGTAHLVYGRPRSLRTPIGGAGPGGFRGLWNPLLIYASFDMVQVLIGTSAGFYMSTLDNNTNAPDSGIGWVQYASFATWL